MVIDQEQFNELMSLIAHLNTQIANLIKEIQEFTQSGKKDAMSITDICVALDISRTVFNKEYRPYLKSIKPSGQPRYLQEDVRYRHEMIKAKEL